MAVKKKVSGVRERKRREVYMRRSLSIFRNMRTRLGDLPFKIDELRSKIKRAIGAPCRYCGATVTVKTFSADHRVPISQEGAISLRNLDIICGSCNTAKGEITEGEYCGLLELIEGWSEISRRDLVSRIKAGAAVKRLRFLGRK